MDVKVKSVHLVAKWMWDCKGDTCGICRQEYEAACPACRVPGDDCPVLTSPCHHTFHLHCITRALEKEDGQQECPTCRAPWHI